MKQSAGSPVEIRDIAEGLWIWRLKHPHWKPGQGWEPVVASTCVDSRGERLVLDPLSPPMEAAEVWQRLDAQPPSAVVVLKYVIVSHGEPVHSRAAYERALNLAPWKG